ncbi:MAG: hypothetical protein QXJ53_04115 [Candidatus Bathyarchaeia archaeon]
MRFESAAMVVFTICIFLSFYFVYLSFQTIEDAMRKQFVAFAAYSLLTGVITLACVAVYIQLKRTFTFEQLQTNKAEQ